MSRDPGEPPSFASSSRYEELLNSIDAVVWEADAETWQFTFVSQKAERLFGYPVSEWLGDPAFWIGRLVHPEDRERAAAICRTAAEQELEHEFDYRARTADGEVIWVRDRVRSVPAEPGGRKLLRGVMMDVTAAKQMADSLRENEERFSRIAATSPDGIITIDDQSIIAYVNPAAEALFGYSSRELVGKPLTDLMPARFRAHHLSGLQRYASTGDRKFGNAAATLVGLTRNGIEIPIEIAFGDYQKGGKQYFTGFIRDLTERNSREQALQESEELLREITEAIHEVFWLSDPHSKRILYVSPGYEAIWGRTTASLYADNTSWLEAIHPEDRARVEAALPGQVTGNYDVEYRIVRSDGEVRWVRDRAYPVQDASAEVVRVAGVAEDITSFVVAEQELRQSEERLRLAALATQDVIWDWDLASGRDTWSAALSHRFGYPPELRETDGYWWEERLHPDDHDRVMDSINRCIRTGAQKWSEEYRFRRADGTWAYVLDRGYLVVDASGAPTRMIGAMMDQTEWHSSQAALRASEERFRAMIEHSAEIISILDSNGIVRYQSPTITRILGYDPEELNGENVFDFVHPDDVGQVAAVFGRVAREEEVTTVIEFRFRRRDGSYAVLSSVGNNALNNPAVQGIVVNSHDVTRERLRDAHLRRAERLASIGTLVGGVAHELNNPLHAIMGFADLLLMESRNQDEQETLETIRREARRAAKIVSELRLLARQTQEAARMQDRVDLNDIVAHVLKTREYQFRAHNIEVAVELAAELPQTTGDAGQIEQVVLNLVVNAEQATQSVMHERRIVIRTRTSGIGVELSVADNGTGIARENFDRLFDPFWTTKQPGEGTGLGLSLAHSIVTEHGGRIRVESKPGEGATFTVELPGAEADTHAASGVTEGRASEVERPPEPRLRVLVVEDEEPVRRLLERFLVRWGHAVDSAADGRQALERISAAEMEGREYQVILSDLRMPGMSGEALLHHLRARGPEYEKRLAFLTGDVSSLELERVLNEADIPVLQKPYEPDRLREVVEKLGRAGN